jgi:hypothetical protein
MAVRSILRHLVYLMAIKYIFGNFGIFSPILVRCTKKNLATLQLGGCFLRGFLFLLQK